MPCVKNPLFNHGLLYNKGRNIKEHLFRHRTQISHYWWKISHYTCLHPIKYHQLIPLLSHHPILFGWFVVWICFFDFSILCEMITPIDSIFFRWLETTKHLQYCFCFAYIYISHTYNIYKNIIIYIYTIFPNYISITPSLIPSLYHHLSCWNSRTWMTPSPGSASSLKSGLDVSTEAGPGINGFSGFGPLGYPSGLQQRKWQYHGDI